ncbi:MAG: endolytic transglycosylase MltG [Lachnospiraceae bacterium]|nr:endolytic transglycosylase MltG [Lachnospiraceae bacterium]
MKLKYFLRGVGVGIIFGALIMLVAYLTSGASKMSDDEIIKRAENLGMVMNDDLVITGIKEDEDTQVTTEELPEYTSQVTEENTTGALIQDSDVSLEGVVDESINTTTEADTTESTNANYVTAKISVTSGMTSTEVALLLQDAGIIDDYLDFDQYLNENGYSTQIRINEYDFNNNMTYEELAKALVKEDKQ